MKDSIMQTEVWKSIKENKKMVKDVEITLSLEDYERLILAKNQLELIGKAYEQGFYNTENVLAAIFRKDKNDAE